MSDSEVLIRVEGVSKKFCRSLKKSLWYGLQDVISELNPFHRNGPTHDSSISPSSFSPLPSPLSSTQTASPSNLPSSNSDPHSAISSLPSPLSSPDPALRADEFWAVKDVSFELRRGECLGLIGRNGAGKTTLLKMLNGLIKPDKGRISMRGRVGALIALGAGFNPVLTGRENIYTNAAVLGLSKRETDAKVEEIIDFAEITDFIDAPVQTYSSGMQVRLGFAVATALEPDILLLDEVLAVGDAGFRHKCYSRLSKLLARTAVILVTHSMEYVAQTCSAVVMVRRGSTSFYNEPLSGIAAYTADNTSRGRHEATAIEAIYPPIKAAKVRVLTPIVRYAGKLSIEVEIDSMADLADIMFSFSAHDQSGQPVMCLHTSRRSGQLDLYQGRQLLLFRITPLLLHDGIYRWTFDLVRRKRLEHLIWFVRAGEFTVTSDFRPVGSIPYLIDPSMSDLTCRQLAPCSQ